MLRPLTDLPDGVIGFEADGKLEAEDYRDTLVPAVEAAIADGRDVRIVLEFPSWDGLTGGAMWEDLKMGVSRITHWKRIALVTDLEWMQNLVKLFGWMTPGELKHFSMDDRDDAIEWAAAGD